MKETRYIKNHQDYLKLIDEINTHDLLYYQECAPIISDYEYDLLMKLLEQYEREHLNEMVSHSPTKRVSGEVSKGFEQKEHIKPMLSLSNTYSEKEIEDFINRVEKILNRKVSFCLELKLDGTAISLRYVDGCLTTALTRGNGKIGDDVTNNIKTIRSIPLKLQKDVPSILEVRGEVFMNKEIFQQLNVQREEDGLELFANPRNGAAGSLKLLDPKVVAKRKLNLICYGVAEGQEEVEFQYEIHNYLKTLGLPVAKNDHYVRASNLTEIMAFVDKIDKIRSSLPFEIDGIVIKVDELKTYEILGETGKSPRYAIAYKFAPEQAQTQIIDILVQVGRTGVLTPVAHLQPTHLAGSVISKATLHNQDEIVRKDIRVGDWVIIEKGGDVIPKVVEVDLQKRTENSKIWKMPDKCPVCQTQTVKCEGEVAIRCPNSNCQGRVHRRLTYFASKHGMDIEHLGERIVEQLEEKKLISKPSDIYLLTEKELSLLDGFKEKSIQNLLSSIERSKKCSLDKFIKALEIKYVGQETAELLSDEAPDLNTLINMSKEKLLEINGIGEKVAQSIIEFFQNRENIEEIEQLLKNGVEPRSLVKKKIENHLFSNKSFVLTGTLEHFSRDKATALIKERGGKVNNSVSKNTDFVLVGADPGSKYEKAKKMQINILFEEEFTKLL